VRPGFSLKKLLCDAVMALTALRMACRKRYDVVHAVEESVFIALLFKCLFRWPYIYDMDSSLVQQMIEQKPFLEAVAGPLRFWEKLAVRHAHVVIPVCEALKETIATYQPNKVVVVQDVSLLPETGDATPKALSGSLKASLGLDGVLVMYVGNLEPYQGIGLLLESFALVRQQSDQPDLVIIGGERADIVIYQRQARQLGIDTHVHFLGPQPISDLASYLSQADILVSPRIRGNNTPMKLYSYLHSGKALVATDLLTHTQVLNHRVSILAKPSPTAFSQGLLELINHPERRLELGRAGKNLVEEEYSYTAFRRKLDDLYNGLAHECVHSSVPRI
jgi:glycosyltransferase involved in cell wall biosynthesis